MEYRRVYQSRGRPPDERTCHYDLRSISQGGPSGQHLSWPRHLSIQCGAPSGQRVTEVCRLLQPAPECRTCQHAAHHFHVDFGLSRRHDGTAALDLTGSDGRLEVQIQPGSLDLSHATSSSGSAPVGALSVHLVQIYGHSTGQKSLLGSYQLQLVDSQGNVVNGLILYAPVTIIYHYQPSELADQDHHGHACVAPHEHQ